METPNELNSPTTPEPLPNTSGESENLSSGEQPNFTPLESPQETPDPVAETPEQILQRQAAEAQARQQSPRRSAADAVGRVRSKRGTKPVKKPARTATPKEESQDPESDAPFTVTSDDVNDLLDIADVVLESFNIEKLTPRNRKAIVKPMTRLANKYLPAGFGKFSDETKLGLGVAAIVLERLPIGKQDRRRVRDERDGENDTPHSGSGRLVPIDSVGPHAAVS